MADNSQSEQTAAPPVPIFDPSGTLRAIPYDQMVNVVKNGGRVALRMKAPDGRIHYIPDKLSADAVKSGGTILPIQEQPKGVPEWYGFTPSNVGKNMWTGAEGLVKSLWSVGKDLANNPNWFEGKDSTAQKFVYGPSDEEVKKVRQNLGRHRYSEAFGHAVAAALPMVGPWAASLGEQAGTGDIGGAAGQAAGTVAAGTALAKLPKTAKESASAIKNVGSKGVEAAKPAAPEARSAQEIKQITTGVKSNFAERLDRTITRGYLPEIERVSKPRNVREASEAILDYADKIQKDVVKPAVARHATETVSGDTVAKAVRDVLTPEIEKYFPESLGPIAKEAGRYDGKEVALDEANVLIEKLNGINRSLEKASPEDAAAAEKVNVAKAASRAAADKLRELLYDKLDSLGEKGIRDYQKDYGALRTVGEALRDKAPRAERIGKGPSLLSSAFRKHPWLTLGSILGGYGVLHTSLGAFVPFLNWAMDMRGTPNATIARAMKRLGKTGFEPVKPPVELSGDGGVTPVKSPETGKGSGGTPTTPDNSAPPTPPNIDNEEMRSASRQFMDDKVSPSGYKELLRKAMPAATEETLNRTVKSMENLKRSRKPATTAPAPVPAPAPATGGPPLDPLLQSNASALKEFTDGKLTPGAFKERLRKSLINASDDKLDDLVRQAEKFKVESAVIQGGGKFVGIQEGYNGSPSLVQFNPLGGGTTMAIPIDEITPEAVRKKLAEGASAAEPKPTTSSTAPSVTPSATLTPAEASQLAGDLKRRIIDITKSEKGELSFEADPKLLDDVVRLGKHYVRQGLNEYGAWSKQMTRMLGEAIGPHLEQLWAKSLNTSTKFIDPPKDMDELLDALVVKGEEFKPEVFQEVKQRLKDEILKNRRELKQATAERDRLYDALPTDAVPPGSPADIADDHVTDLTARQDDLQAAYAAHIDNQRSATKGNATKGVSAPAPSKGQGEEGSPRGSLPRGPSDISSTEPPESYTVPGILADLQNRLNA